MPFFSHLFVYVSDVVPSEQIIDIGRQARLECLTEERHRELITWRKDGKELNKNDKRFVVDSHDSVLRIYNLRRDDYGMYQCFVGREEAQAASELRLGDAKPQLTYRFIEQTLQPNGLAVVSLKCAARGSPTPRIQWTVDGFPLPRDDR